MGLSKTLRGGMNRHAQELGWLENLETHISYSELFFSRKPNQDQDTRVDQSMYLQLSSRYNENIIDLGNHSPLTEYTRITLESQMCNSIFKDC